MKQAFYINKIKLALSILAIILSIYLIFYFFTSEAVKENFNSKRKLLQELLPLCVPLLLLRLYSHLVILFWKKEALIIADDCIIDRTCYESIGKIYFSEIKRIQKIGKYSIEIILKQPVFVKREINFIKKFLLFLKNWNYKKSVIIISSLLNCKRDNLESTIKEALRNSRYSYPSKLGK